jgi:hypothetical protein
MTFINAKVWFRVVFFSKPKKATLTNQGRNFILMAYHSSGVSFHPLFISNAHCYCNGEFKIISQLL